MTPSLRACKHTHKCLQIESVVLQESCSESLYLITTVSFTSVQDQELLSSVIRQTERHSDPREECGNDLIIIATAKRKGAKKSSRRKIRLNSSF